MGLIKEWQGVDLIPIGRHVEGHELIHGSFQGFFFQRLIEPNIEDYQSCSMDCGDIELTITRGEGLEEAHHGLMQHVIVREKSTDYSLVLYGELSKHNFNRGLYSFELSEDPISDIDRMFKKLDEFSDEIYNGYVVDDEFNEHEARKAVREQMKISTNIYYSPADPEFLSIKR